MRVVALALVVITGAACSRRSLQEDAGGIGSIGLDGGNNPADGGAGPTDGVVLVPDGFGPPTDARTCGISSIAAGGRIPIEILLVLDQSVAGDQTGWRNLKLALIDQINAHAGAFDWGLYAFPTDGPACGAAAITAGPDIPLGIGVSTHLTVHIFAAAVDKNGTPTAAAITAGAAYLDTITNANPKFLMLVTDGAPTCAGTTGALSDDAAQAQVDAVAAITAAYAAGFPTIVVAPSTTTNVNDVAALNALAAAGRYARSSGNLAFHTELTLAEVFVPAGDGASCTFPLQSRPPVPDDVTVSFNGTVVPRDRLHMNGWDYTSTDHAAIQFYGSWCELAMSTRPFQVDAVYGCPTFDFD